MPKGVYKRLSEEDRFLKYVNKTETCWLWTASCDEDGYGRFFSPERKAHRFAYRFYKGPLEDGMMILHSCDNPPCCNPAHLRLGTAQDNMNDCKTRGRLNSVNAWKPGDCVGELNPRAKLTIEDIQAIRARHAAGLKYGELKKLAIEYGIAYITIQKIVANKLWIE